MATSINYFVNSDQIPKNECRLPYLLWQMMIFWVVIQVWKAEAQDIAGYSGTLVVAVKTSKEHAPEKEKSDLIQEMKIMQQIGGTHPNIVTLLGICTDKGT